MTEKHSSAGSDTGAIKHAVSPHGVEGESAASKMSSEAMSGLAGLNQMQSAHESRGSDPEVLKMLSGFSIGNGDNTNATGAGSGAGGFESNVCTPQNLRGLAPESAQIGAAAIGSIMSGLADVGKDFAGSQDTDSASGADDSSAMNSPSDNPQQYANNSDASADSSEPEFPPTWMKRIFEKQNSN